MDCILVLAARLNILLTVALHPRENEECPRRINSAFPSSRAGVFVASIRAKHRQSYRRVNISPRVASNRTTIRLREYPFGEDAESFFRLGVNPSIRDVTRVSPFGRKAAANYLNEHCSNIQLPLRTFD